VINGSKFIQCVSVGNGGAISFSDNVIFDIKYTNFTNCETTTGLGGAISSSSQANGNRQIHHCNFVLNKASTTLTGLDIYDNSGNGISYYNQSSILNCTSSSTSTSSGFVLFAVVNDSNTLMFDCLLTGECGGGSRHIHGTNGMDWNLCGAVSTPCQTLSYIINSVSSGTWINILYDENPYYFRNYQFPGSRTNLIQGINNSNSEKPIISTNYSGGNNSFNYYNYESYTTMHNFKVVYDMTQGSGNCFLIYVFADYGAFNIRYICILIFVYILFILVCL
jgi:hypothetical protein